jgi:hypothetical protein
MGPAITAGTLQRNIDWRAPAIVSARLIASSFSLLNPPNT